MTNIEKEEVTLSQLIKRSSERLPLYNEKAIKEIITVFMEELRDAMIKSCCVNLKGFFAFRHKWRNAKKIGNFGSPMIYPAHMTIVTTLSRTKILTPLNKHYKETGKQIPGSLYDIPLKDFK